MAVEDKTTDSLKVVDYAHHEIHEGSHFFLLYSVADIGALTTPNDMMTLSWTTPDTEKLLHWIFEAVCTGGARVRLIEGKTGGGATPTGTLQSYNNKRDSDKVSTILDVAGANAGKVSYDATLFTGGVSLLDEYLTGTGIGGSSPGAATRSDSEKILKRNTAYQLSIEELGNVPATLKMLWYEHTSRRS